MMIPFHWTDLISLALVGLVFYAYYWASCRQFRLDAKSKGQNGHIWDDCTPQCNKPGCWICEGGLAICVRCHCIEGSLTSECPGVPVPARVQTLIYKGVVDFVGGQWRPSRSIHLRHQDRILLRIGTRTEDAVAAMRRLGAAFARASSTIARPDH